MYKKSILMIFIFAISFSSLPILNASGVDLPEKLRVDSAEKGEKVAVYFSNGDNELLMTSPAVDSPVVIRELMELLKKVYGVQRIYWRVPEIVMMLDYSEIRNANFNYAKDTGGMTGWLEYCFKTLGTEQASIKETKSAGMEAWGVAPLFNHGAQADIDSSKAGGPHFVESRLRIQNPQWIPVDKYGIRRMPGPISFEYPEARKALVKEYSEIAQKLGLEGLTFHTYIENFGVRFDDEFGFNEPIVQEYRKRYGVDIRKEKYDVDKLARLRGEYLTQFFRELHAEFKAKGIKLGLMLSAKYPNEPQRWLCTPDVRVSGRIYIDWEKLADEGLVDEFFVYVHGAPFEAARKVMAKAKGKGISVAIMNSRNIPDEFKDLKRDGIIRCIAGAYEELECGSADVKDGFADKLNRIYLMGTGQAQYNAPELIQAMSDSHALVRRLALRSVYQIGKAHPEMIKPAVIAAVKKCLNDPENVVRCTAVHTLATVGGPEDMDALYQTVAKYGNRMMYIFPAGGLAVLPQHRTSDLIKGLQHPSDNVKYFTLTALRGSRPRPEVFEYLRASAVADNPRIRHIAANVIGRYPQPEVQEVLFTLLGDPDPTVRSMAAMQLSQRMKTESRWVDDFQLRVISKLAEMFREYGNTVQPSDGEWGWRPVGEALLRMGPRGKEILESYLNQNDNKLLADRAWRVLYCRIDGFKHLVITPEEAESGYLKHPSVRKGLPKSNLSQVVEPAMMPYIVPDFTGDSSPDQAGNLGTGTTETGLWRRLGGLRGKTAFANRLAKDPDDESSVVLRFEKSNQGLNNSVQALRSGFRFSKGNMKVSFKVYLVNKNSGLNVWIGSSSRFSGNMRAGFGPEGKIKYTNDKMQWIDSPVTIPLKSWVPVRITSNTFEKTFSIEIQVSNTWSYAVKNIPVTDVTEFNNILFLPGGTDGTAVYLKDFAYEVDNPAFKSGAKPEK